ncbi:MAG: hypothetical protein QOJ00_913 [Actinomycetota bacterium]|jgi:hemerythrin superfamily protein
MTTNSTDLSGTQLLRERHEQIKQLFQEVLDLTGDERAEAFDCLRATLAVHETVEEMFVHPLAREIGPEAEAVARARIEEEQQATQMLSDLEHLGVEGDQFATRLVMFRHAVIEHAEAEENELFPLIEGNCSQEDLKALGDSIITAEQIAPTHAHPHTPKNPAVLMLTGPFVAMVDHARDHFRKLRVE